MSDIESAEAELPLDNAGTRLLRAREAAGLSRTQLAGITRIPERHLAAIEAADYAALPARAYAVGFARSYAKAVGLNPDVIAATVRGELDAGDLAEPRRQVQTFEPGDPARVPRAGLVWAALLGIVVVLAAVFVLARAMITPGMNLPSILAEQSAAPPPVAAPPPAAPAPVAVEPLATDAAAAATAVEQPPARAAARPVRRSAGPATVPVATAEPAAVPEPAPLPSAT